MRSFCQFLESKVTEEKIRQCAELIVLEDIDPRIFLVDFFESEEIFEEGFFRNLWGATKGMFKGAAAGWRAASSGELPKNSEDAEMKFQNAVSALTAVADFLKSSDGNTNAYLTKMIGMLTKRVGPALNQQPQQAQPQQARPQQRQPQQRGQGGRFLPRNIG